MILHVPAENWSPLPTAELGAGERRFVRMDQHHYFDTIIEVLDPERGRLVASSRFGDKLEGFIGPGLLFAYRENSDGAPLYEILRLRVEGRSAGASALGADHGVAPTIEANCSVDCWSGQSVGCADQWHRAYTGGDMNERGGGAHASCRSGTCGEQHKVCDGDGFVDPVALPK